MRACNIICSLANQKHLFKKIWWDSHWLGEVTKSLTLLPLGCVPWFWNSAWAPNTAGGSTHYCGLSMNTGSLCLLCSIPSISRYSVKCKVRLTLILYPWARISEGSYEFKCIRYQLVVGYLPEESLLKTLCFKAAIGSQQNRFWDFFKDTKIHGCASHLYKMA